LYRRAGKLKRSPRPLHYRLVKRNWTVLNLEQYLELLLGPNGGSAFGSDFARQSAWRRHRAELLPLVDPGSRPWAWWQYDAPQPVLPREPELHYLQRCGLLSEREEIRLSRAGVPATFSASAAS